MLNDLREALIEQARAFFAADPQELERANVRVTRVLRTLRDRPTPLDARQQAALRQLLRTQGELLTRARASNHIALRTLDLPVFPYPAAGTYPNADVDASGRRHRTHVLA
ncbi:MAG: hypothetical protein QM766_16935 [Burkholderiaceae bacterium]